METKKLGKELIGVEIFEVKKDADINQLEKVKTKKILIDDLSTTYLVQIRYLDEPLKDLEILSPEDINPMDAYELNETISNELKELGINSQAQLSENQINQEINEEAIKMFKKIAKQVLNKNNKKSKKNKNKNNG